MQRLIVVGDMHLAVNPPGRRAEGYLDELLDMLDEIVARANEIDADVAFVGDLFHHKRWVRNPHWLVDTLMRKLVELPRLAIVLAGNHDLADGSIESFTRQPIALLGYLDNVRFLDNAPLWVPEAQPHPNASEAVTDPSFYASKDAGIVMVGIPGTAEVTEARNSTLELYSQRCDLLLAHAPISATMKPWPTWQPEDLPLDCGVFIYGHQHDQARLVGNTAAGIPVVATGAIARGSINEAAFEPAIIELAFENHALLDAQVRPLQSARPVGEIYRWAEREAEQAENAAMHSFVTSLSQATLVGFSREGLIDKIRHRQDLAEMVKDLAVEILEDVGP